MTEQNWIRSTCQVVCAYVTRRRQMRRFCSVPGLSALCLQLVFLPHCYPGEVLGDTEVGLADPFTAAGNQSGISTSAALTSFTLFSAVHKSALVVYLVSV